MVEVINGFKIVEDVNMVEFDRLENRERNWYDRLFTIPWNPLKSMVEVEIYKPMDKIFKLGDNLVMHPEVKQRVLMALAKENNYGWEEEVANLIAKEKALGDDF